MIEARLLANQLKFRDRPLLDSSTQDLTLLMAALFVACRKNHEVMEVIRRHRPEKLEELIREISEAERQAPASERFSTRSTLTSKQRHEQKRRKRNRVFSKSIECQFGGSLEALLGWRLYVLPLLKPTAPEEMVRESQTCLDDVFSGQRIHRLKLDELFWMDRHRFAPALRDFPKRRIDYLAVTKVMDFLLKEKRRTKSNRSKPGRSPRLPWLYNKAVRIRVLEGIEARINTLPVRSDIASAFLAIIHAHLPRSGRK